MILIVDPYNNQALSLKPGHHGEIDPTVSGWHYYFYYEKLDIYIPQKAKPSSFYRHYQLTENYCTAGITKLTFNDIAQLVQKPTDRFTVSEFKLHVVAPHENDHH